jgi:hypothetical protein
VGFELVEVRCDGAALRVHTGLWIDTVVVYRVRFGIKRDARAKAVGVRPNFCIDG